MELDPDRNVGVGSSDRYCCKSAALVAKERTGTRALSSNSGELLSWAC